MYTIKHAAEQVGISANTLRAWERRYGIVSPQRTEAGYRVYSEGDVDVLRTMSLLVDEGWTPSLAAREALRREGLPGAPVLMDDSADEGAGQNGSRPQVELSERFVEAAADIDTAVLASVLDEMFSIGSFETVARRYLFPTLTALGDAWASERVSIAAEHFASSAIMRRLSAAYEAAAAFGKGRRILLGMASGGRHEIGLFAFAVAARRRGLDTGYLGCDLPIEDWLSAAAEPGVAALVVAMPTEADVAPTTALVTAIRDRHPGMLIGAGGALQEQAPDGVLRLGHDIAEAAKHLSEILSASPGARSGARP